MNGTYTFIDKDTGICDVSGKPGEQCDGVCVACPKYKEYLIEAGDL